MQEMIADSKKYLALKLQSTCGNSKEPASVLHWMEQPETTSRKSVISKPRMLFRCGYESSKLAIQFLNFNRNVLLSAKMYPKPFQLIWKRFEFSKILGEAGFETK